MFGRETDRGVFSGGGRVSEHEGQRDPDQGVTGKGKEKRKGKGEREHG